MLCPLSPAKLLTPHASPSLRLGRSSRHCLAGLPFREASYFMLANISQNTAALPAYDFSWLGTRRQRSRLSSYLRC